MKGANLVSQCVNSIFNPIMERGRAYVHIIIAGEHFKTTRATVETYPESLLGSDEANEFWDEDRKAYVFPNCCRLSFDNILFFYQSKGLLACPSNVSIAVFRKECEFFKLPQESIDRCEHGIVLDMVLSMEREEGTPRGPLTAWGRKLLAKPWSKKLLGGIDMAATAIYILILMLITSHDSQDDVLTWLSAICVIWFIAHYIINILSTNEKKKYCLSLLSYIDFMVVGSFLLDVLGNYTFHRKEDKKTVKEARILIGVVRQLCIARYSSLLYCLGMALRKSGKDLLHILYILVIVILVFSSAAFFFESESGLFILEEEYMWSEVHNIFNNASDMPIFVDLEKIANKTSPFNQTLNSWNRTYNSSYIIKPDKMWECELETNVELSKIWVFPSVVQNGSLHSSTIQASLVEDCMNSFLSEKIYKPYMEFRNVQDYMQFQPVIDKNLSILQFFVVEGYVAINMTAGNFSVETHSRFRSIPASLWWGFITITTGMPTSIRFFFSFLPSRFE